MQMVKPRQLTKCRCFNLLIYSSVYAGFYYVLPGFDTPGVQFQTASLLIYYVITDTNIRFAHIMKKLIHRPFALFLFTGILLLLVSFIPDERTMDIHLHDTMVVISTTMFLQAVAVFVLVEWGLCLLLNKFLQNQYLNWMQVTGTLLPVIFFVVYSFRQPEPLTGYDIQTYRDGLRWTLLSGGTLVIILLLAQLSFLINLIAGIVKPAK